MRSRVLQRGIVSISAASNGLEDDYEYDSDDYEEFEPPNPAFPPLRKNRFGDSKLERSCVDGEENRAKQPRKKATRAIKKGLNLFLLFGAAVDRFFSRLQQLLLAIVRTTGAVLAAAFRRSPAGRLMRNARRKMEEMQRDLPDDTWGKLLWLWDRPPVQRLRLTISMANLSIRLPALMALIATQVGLLASQVSLPMLAPLLLGTGMLMRSIKTNASFLLPRIGVLVVLLWMLWFANSVVQNTVAYLRKQKALDDRLAGGIITVSECTALLVALVVLLSMLGVNVSALLLPAGIAVAIAAKDLSHNFLAGFFLFVVQPFKLGDRLAISSTAANNGIGFGNGPSWFEGVCEKVDLRYTVVRQGRRRLVIPNSTFLTREFMIVEESDSPSRKPVGPPSGVSEEQAVPYMTADHRHVWQYIQGPPVHQEVAAATGQVGTIRTDNQWQPSNDHQGYGPSNQEYPMYNDMRPGSRARQPLNQVPQDAPNPLYKGVRNVNCDEKQHYEFSSDMDSANNSPNSHGVMNDMKKNLHNEGNNSMADHYAWNAKNINSDRDRKLYSSEKELWDSNQKNLTNLTAETRNVDPSGNDAPQRPSGPGNYENFYATNSNQNSPPNTYYNNYGMYTNRNHPIHNPYGYEPPYGYHSGLYSSHNEHENT